jgi:hypothetical protein
VERQNRLGFMSPGPADVRDEILFETRGDFLSNLHSIADHITRPAVVAESVPPMTFAVYGQWGAGKSTTLRFLKHLVAERVRSAGASFTSSDYDAPLWEHLPDARGTLAYQIVKGMSPDALDRLTKLLRRLAGVADEAPAIRGQEAKLNEALQFWRVLEQLPIAPPLLEEWMREIAEQIGGSRAADPVQGNKHVHVVFVDDIDRCGRQFTANLLAATTYWSSGEHTNIFFVIAASRQHLIDSLREHLPLGADYPEQALEKYVHVSVEVPALLTSAVEVADYITKLVDRVGADGAPDQERIEEFKRLIGDSAKLYPQSVLAPLLRLTDDLTPRTVKHRFNTFLTEFRPQAALTPPDVKRWVLKAFWPDFWWRYLWNLEIGAREPDAEWDRKVELVTRLRELGRGLLPFWGIASQELRPILTHLAERSGTDLQDVDPDLAIYLAVEPVWEPPPRGGEGDIKRTGSQLSGQESEQASTITDEDDGVLLEYLQADQALGAGDAQVARQHLLGVLEATRRGRLTARAASTVGNAALIAERLDAEFALDLHQAAMRLDPRHYNVIQNFIDYVIERRLSDHYPEAERLLEVLRTEGRDYKPERTANLVMRLDLARGLPTTELATQFDQATADLAERPSVRRLAEILPLLIEAKQNDAIRNACRTVAESAASDEDRYAALRLLADALADSDLRADEQEAADLYRFMLASGLACVSPAEDVVDVKHNLATLLSVMGQRNAAALLFEEAYNERPMDQTIRRAFAIVLGRIGREGDGAAVLVGQRIEPLEVRAEPLPARFATQADPWWERLPIERQEPCETVVTRL